MLSNLNLPRNTSKHRLEGLHCLLAQIPLLSASMPHASYPTFNTPPPANSFPFPSGAAPPLPESLRAAPQPTPGLLLGRRLSPAPSRRLPRVRTFPPAGSQAGCCARRSGFAPPRARCRLSPAKGRQRLASGKRCAPPHPSCMGPAGRGRWG